MALRPDVLAALPSNATPEELLQMLEVDLRRWAGQPKLATLALKQVSYSKCAATVATLLDVMRGSLMETNRFHYSVAISACDQARDWTLALSLLERMHSNSILPDVVCLNAVISACEKAAEWHQALGLLESMEKASILPDTISHNAALGACARAGQWELSLQVLRWISLRRMAPDEISFSSAIAACARCDRWGIALSLLACMPERQVLPNVISYTAAMTATANAGLWQHTLQMLSDMRKNLIRADEFTYSSLISAFGRAEEWEPALSALVFFQRTVREPLMQSDVVYNSAISACAAAAQWQRALSVLSSTPSRQIVSCNSAITACARGSAWQCSLLLLNNMLSKRSLDHISCNSAIEACGAGGNWQMAIVLLNSMKGSRVLPTEESFTSVLSGTARAGHWQMCTAVLDLMGELGQVPTAATLGLALTACEVSSAWIAALAFLENLTTLRVVPDALHAGSAVNTLRKAHGANRAMELLAAMRNVWMQHGGAKKINIAASSLQRDAVGDPRVLAVADGVIATLKPDNVTTPDFAEQIAAQFWPGTCSAEVLSIVSRLDLPASGVVPLALGPAGSVAANWLQSQFASRLVQKRYICLCEGPSLGSVCSTGVVTAPLQVDQIFGDSETKKTRVSEIGLEAVTKYEVLARYALPGTQDELMLLAVKPVTGRTHQIRAHMAYLGCPIVGDFKYGRADSSMLPGQRLFLHCRRIKLRDLSGKVFCAKARLPPELRDLLASLRPYLLQADGTVAQRMRKNRD